MARKFPPRRESITYLGNDKQISCWFWYLKIMKMFFYKLIVQLYNCVYNIKLTSVLEPRFELNFWSNNFSISAQPSFDQKTDRLKDSNFLINIEKYQRFMFTITIHITTVKTFGFPGMLSDWSKYFWDRGGAVIHFDLHLVLFFDLHHSKENVRSVWIHLLACVSDKFSLMRWSTHIERHKFQHPGSLFQIYDSHIFQFPLQTGLVQYPH